MLTALLLGFAMSFVGTMPVAGPVSLLVLSCGLEGRFRRGLWLAGGAAAAEAVWAGLAWVGVGEILPRVPVLMHLARGGAAVLLSVLGVVFLRRPDPSLEPTAECSAASRGFPTGFGISALNPTFLATWTGAAATAHAAGAPTGTLTAPVFALGVAAGAVAWFALLLALLRRHRHRLRPRTLGRIVRLLGAAVLGIGLWFAVAFLRRLA